VRVTVAGSRAFVLDYCTKSGRRRRMTVGDWAPAFGIAKAREQAAQHQASVANGEDPLGTRIRDRQTYIDRPTVGDLFADFMREHVEIHDSLRTIIEYRNLYHKHVRPYLAERAVTDVTTGDVSAVIQATETQPTPDLKPSS
jgi:hypothetical protein